MLSVFIFGACSSDAPKSSDVEFIAPTSSAITSSAEENAETFDQPYAGLQNRTIKAVDPQRVDDLLAGKGAGFALAAELNSYPGPTHVLKMAETLELSSDQKSEVEGLFDVMSNDAKTLGQVLVSLEADLDQSFREGTIDQSSLIDLTEKISVIEGQLRALHLGTHLTMVNILSDDQITEYDRLRGYSDAEDGSTEMDHESMSEHG
ncbi:hypothetical protein JYU04_03025 [Dehalococcoides mccartyi]|nr:hypothetical protein [Dehalococcoides mccartyi]